jgi:hypothetical protein
MESLAQDASIAVRTKVRKALEILDDEKKEIPPNWIKARK